MILKKLSRISTNGFIDDPEDVKEIVLTLSTLKIGDITKYSREESGLSSLTYVYDLTYADFESLSFLDVICLIGNMDKGILDGTAAFINGPTPGQFKKLQIELLRRALFEAMKADIIIRQFMGINIRSLFVFLESKHNDGRVKHLYNQLIKEWNKIKDSTIRTKPLNTMNVGTVLDVLNEALNRPWRCWRPFDEYQEGINRLSNIETLIIIEGFFEGFREQMNVHELATKLTEEYDYNRVERMAFLENSYTGNEV